MILTETEFEGYARQTIREIIETDTKSLAEHKIDGILDFVINTLGRKAYDRLKEYSNNLVTE